MRAELPLHAGHPVLGVRRHIVRIDRRNAHQRFELAPIDMSRWDWRGWRRKATFCSGNRWPASAPVAATVNGESKSGGAAEVYV